MKVEKRDKRFMIRVKPSEWNYLVKEADERGIVVSEFVRAVLFATAAYPALDGRK